MHHTQILQGWVKKNDNSFKNRYLYFIKGAGKYGQKNFKHNLKTIIYSYYFVHISSLQKYFAVCVIKNITNAAILNCSSSFGYNF